VVVLERGLVEDTRTPEHSPETACDPAEKTNAATAKARLRDWWLVHTLRR
jgi:hypothetical protein